MSAQNAAEYHERRAERERALAEASANRQIAAIHTEIAARHVALGVAAKRSEVDGS